MVGPCEHGNKSSDFIQYVEFLDEMSSSKFVQDAATGRQLNATVWICINIQQCISQTQQNFIMFIIALGQHFSFLIE